MLYPRLTTCTQELFDTVILIGTSIRVVPCGAQVLAQNFRTDVSATAVHLFCQLHAGCSARFELSLASAPWFMRAMQC